MALAKPDHQTIDAIYEHGTLRLLHPEEVDLSEGQKVRVVIEPTAADTPLDSLELLGGMYDGLSEDKIKEIEGIILDRSNFFGDRPLL